MSIVPKTKQDAADELRRMIRRIEEARSPSRPRLPLGVPAIDRVLPGGGLRLGCIHEVTGDEAATGFCAALLARVGSGEARAGPAEARGRTQADALLWLAQGDDLYAPGLVRYGIGAGQLLVVSGLHRQDDMLWAMEEALRCRAVRGVVAEVGGMGFAAGRRLMLAAEGTGVLGLVLSRRVGVRRGGVGGGGGAGGGAVRAGGGAVRAAVSRWRVTAARGGVGADETGVQFRMPNGQTPPETDDTRWRVELLHCRGGRPAEWVVGWEDTLARPRPGHIRASRGWPWIRRGVRTIRDPGVDAPASRVTPPPRGRCCERAEKSCAG